MKCNYLFAAASLVLILSLPAKSYAGRCYYFTGETDGCDNEWEKEHFGEDNTDCEDGAPCRLDKFVGYYCPNTYRQYSDATWDGYEWDFEIVAESGGYRDSLITEVVCYASAPCSCTQDEEPVCYLEDSDIFGTPQEVVEIDINSVCPEDEDFGPGDEDLGLEDEDYGLEEDVF
jgi:hypothetical protein